MKYFLILMLICVPFAIGKPVWSQSNQKVESSRRLSLSNTDKVQTKSNTNLPSKKYGIQIEKVAKKIEMLPLTILIKDIKAANQIGVERKTNLNFRNQAKVSPNPDGSTIKLLMIRSPAAAGVRVNFDGFDLPIGDEVWIYGTGESSQVFGPYTERGPWPDSDFWSGIVEGDTAIIEYHSKSNKGNFKISKISHIFDEAALDLKRSLTPPPPSCQVDASCSNDIEKNSVARISYQKGGGTFVCSSTLLNDSDNATWIPYLLTANHCISTQAVAQTVAIYWFYQTAACNSGTVGSGVVQTGSGANLLATARDSDSTLLRLIHPAPMGAEFSGWIANPVNSGVPVFGLHHPGGGVPPSLDSFLRRSAGQTGNSTTCPDTGLTQGLAVNWTIGTTEQGSSGSGLWQKDAFGTYLVGTLSCGSTSPCSNRRSSYGRFSSFYPRIQSYLGSPTCRAGGLDNTFGANGTVITPIGNGDDGIASIVIQSDGRIIAAGYSGDDFALVRYKPNGSLDTSFGTGGKVITSITNDSDGASSVALQSDGKIVVAGRSHKPGTLLEFDFAVVRYDRNGSLDTSFGSGGKVTTNVGIGNAEISSVAIQSDGKIVVVGKSQRALPASFSSFAVVRYKSTGLLDTSFGTGGKVTTAIGDQSEANSVALQSDGRIVVAGYSGDASGIGFAVARYKTDGTLDQSFNFDGIVTTSLSMNGNQDIAYSVAIQPSDGKIVVAGESDTPYRDLAVVRYEPNGLLDPSFGIGGVVVTDMRTNSPEGGRDVALQSDGKIIVVGNSFGPSWYSFALVRYDPYGSLDSTFGKGGILTLPIGTDGASTIAIQPNGQIVVGGDNSNGSNMDFALVRLNPNCS
ncbi:MAG TPA: delta-60 repeat domain-containing protein [Pyrinomonadaceae bacterium]|nr:delta-60 repeat domain-containing protein [Pyrinomonadaceae bacterium]